MQFCSYSDTDKLNQEFAQQLIEVLAQAIEVRGHAYIAVSGGKTPRALFQRLANSSLDWEKVTILLADERWVEPEHADSNEHLVKAYLLQNNASAAQFISLYARANHAAESISIIQTRLKQLPKFDAVILGMGEDGHTASLFPCSAEIREGLSEADAPVIAISPKTAPYSRISLTKTRLMNSRHIYLHLVGEQKLKVLNKAVEGENEDEMPIRAFIHHSSTPLQVMYAPA